MLDLNGLFWLVKVVDAGSMSQAARRGQVAVSTVSARIAQLEEQLQVRLLERSTRSLRLTEAGRLFYERACLAVSSAENAQSVLADWNRSPSGVLTVTLSPELTRSRLQSFPRLMTERYPGLELKLILTTERLNLLMHNIDLAIRAGSLDSSQLVAQRLFTTHTYLVASREYIARRGMPDSPHQLAEHDCIINFSLRDGYSRSTLWRLSHNGQQIEVEPRGPISTSSIGSALDFARQGLGIAMTTDTLCDLQNEPELQRVLPEWQMPDAPIWAVYPSKDYLPAKVRAAIAVIRELQPGGD